MANSNSWYSINWNGKNCFFAPGAQLSQIEDASLKAFLSRYDGDGNGSLDDAELKSAGIFTVLGTTTPDVTANTDAFEKHNSASSATSNPITYTTDVSNTQGTQKNTSSGDAKHRQKIVQKKIREYAKDRTMSLTSMMNQWDDPSSSISQYTAEKAEVQAIIDAMGDFKTDKDVLFLEETTRKNLGKNITKFQNAIMDDMLELAEREAVIKNAKAYVEAYTQASQSQDIETKNYQQIYNETVKDLSKKDDYSKETADVVKQVAKADAVKTYDNDMRKITLSGELLTSKNLVEELKREYYDNEQMVQALEAIDANLSNEEVIQSLEQTFANNPVILADLSIIKNARQYTSVDNIIDTMNTKYAKDAIMLEVIKDNEKVYVGNTFKEGPANIAARTNTSVFRQQELSSITEADITSEFGNSELGYKLRTYLKQHEAVDSEDSITAKYPASLNQDGTYNMDRLYYVVNNRSGIDYFTDRSTSKPMYDEFNNIQKDLKYDGLDLTEDELKKLLTYMKRDDAVNNHNVGECIIGPNYLKDAAVGLVAGATTIGKTVINAPVHVLVKLGVNAEQLVKDITVAGGTAEVSGTNIIIDIARGTLSWDLIGLLTVPAATILADLAWKVIVGLPPEENPCSNLVAHMDRIIDECGDDPKKLQEYISKLGYSSRAVSSLNSYIMLITTANNGKFDTKEFLQKINRDIGSGSFEKCAELRAAGYHTRRTVVEQQQQKPDAEIKVIEEKGEEPVSVTQTMVRTLEQGKDWVGHTYEYPCLRDLFDKTEIRYKGVLQNTDRKAARALKIIQAIDPAKLENYINDETKLAELVRMSFEEPAKLKENKDLDYNLYCDFLTKGNTGMIYLPEFLLCDREKDKYANQNYERVAKSRANAKDSYDITITTDGKDGKVRVKFGNDVTEHSTMEAANRKIEEIKANNKDKYNEIKVTTVTTEEEFNK